MYNLEKIREDFPILKREINGRKLVYLDNAATTQKPKQVLDVLDEYYTKHNANIHRGVHTLSQEATDLYEDAHKKVGKFLNLRHPFEETIFVRNATEAMNIVAYGWAMHNLERGDEIVSTVIFWGEKLMKKFISHSDSKIKKNIPKSKPTKEELAREIEKSSCRG